LILIQHDFIKGIAKDFGLLPDIEYRGGRRRRLMTTERRCAGMLSTALTSA